MHQYNYCDMYLVVYQAVLASIRASEDVMKVKYSESKDLQ